MTNANPFPVDQVVSAALGGMVMGPMPLVPALEFHASQLPGSVAPKQDDLVVHLQSASDEDPIVGRIRQALAAWDFAAADAAWAEGTPPNSADRRALVYDRLGLSSALYELLDARTPPYIPADPPALIRLDRVEPWYDSGKAALSPFYWPRYREYLLKRWPNPNSVQALDRSTMDIMEQLNAPWAPGVYASRGLVVGHVQSGKTANFTGLIARAVDAGYRLIIVLGGTMDILRRQTQRRLDKELVGRELVAEDYGQDPDFADFISYGTRPSNLGMPEIERLTGPDEDYQRLKKGIAALEFPRKFPDAPFFDRRNLIAAPARIVVIKKNVAVLKRLAKDLARIQALLGDIPALVVDDESDQATPNTARPPRSKRTREEEDELKKRTATNEQIVKLLELLPRAQYVGYTATPFANVFIDPDDPKDLFPRDFIRSLERPPDYMGAEDFHDFDPQAGTANRDDHVRSVTGDDDEPENLRRALDAYVLTGAVKLWRQRHADVTFRHHTMLIHSSVKKSAHSDLAEMVRELFVHSGFDHGDGLARLKALWDGTGEPGASWQVGDPIREIEHESFRAVSARRAGEWPVPRDFDALVPFVGECLQRIDRAGSPVVVVNGDSKETPDFEKEEVWRILVGGAKLSRGYTVEGLTVSYFRRTAGAVDTLMQAGRWFGYRRGYRDLVRLFIGRAEAVGSQTLDLYAAFEAACRDERDFREQLARYSGEITPQQVPPLVPAHLLRPTAQNKMFNARLTAENLKERWIERTLAPVGDDTAYNQDLMSTLLAGSDVQVRSLLVANQGYSARVASLEPTQMLDFLRRYRWLPGEHPMERVIDHLDGRHFDPEIDRWLLIAPVRSSKKTTVTWPGPGGPYPVVDRSRTDDNGRFGVYTGSVDRPPAKILAGIDPITDRPLAAPNQEAWSPDLVALFKPRQAVMVFVPVLDTDRNEAKPTMGFALQLPTNHSEVRVVYEVRKASEQDEVVVVDD